MRIHPSLAIAFGLLLTTASLTHAVTVFNDTFANGSTVGGASNPVAAGNATSYDVASSRTSPTNAIVANALRMGFGATTSGFIEAQTRFTNFPVALATVGNQISLTATFTATTNIISGTATAGSYLCIGLYNSGSPSVNPLTNLASAGLSGTAGSANANGGVKLWQGFMSRIAPSALGNSNLFTRPQQTGVLTSSENQDLIGSNWGGGAYKNPAGVNLNQTATGPAFTSGATYTLDYKIALTAATTVTITSRIFAGTGTGGTLLFTQTTPATAANFLTSTFDGLAIGYRYSSATSAASQIDISSVTVVTDALTTILPVISTQPPVTQTSNVADNVSLAVVADGGGATALTYQWFKDNVVISGAQSATLNFPSAALTDSGAYKVTVTNAAGTVTSTTTTLTITGGAIAPAIQTHPASASILVGGANTFSVTAIGTATLTYQWQKSTDGGTNFTDIPGATGTSHAITGAILTDAGHFRCVVTNAQGFATSTAAILTVNQAPAITTQPVAATLAVGAPLTLSVTATGTPAPTFQWKKNGVNLSGATSSSYAVGSVSGADTANYTVAVSNSVSTVTSTMTAVVVLSPTLAPTALTPASAATGRNPDTRLAITFNTAVTPGVSGFLRIHDASTHAVVDTIDLATATTLRDSLRATSTLSTLNLPVQNKSIGGTTNFNYYPLTVSGTTVTVYPRDGVLAYNKSYYVKIDAGAFVTSGGESFAGISDTSTWTFSTKAAGPLVGATAVSVAADSTGDFDTVQGAIDWVPTTNAAPLTITIKNGSYFEQIAFINKNFLTFVGQDRTQTTIVYPNNNNFNNVSGGIYHRATFIGSGVHDINVENLKFYNSTPQGGSQAEAFIFAGSANFTARNLITKCSFYSFQDTLQLNKQCYISDSYIEGDVDFMWGSGPCFFSNCDIKMLRTGGYFAQVRNTSATHGFVYANCRFTAGAGFSGNYLNRIDPRSTGFPNSEVVLMNSKIGDATNNAFLNTTVGVNSSDYKAGWWLLNGTTSPTTETASIRNWDYNTVDGTDSPLTFAARPAFTVMPTDPTTLANYSDPVWVLNTTWAGVSSGSWTPTILPTFLTQPQGQSVAVGSAVTLSVDVAAVPAATYQWFLNDVAIGGATASSHSLPTVSGTDWGTYKVVATTTGGSATSSLVTLTPTGPPTSNPTADGDGDGFSNLMEYGFGTDPAISSSAAITHAGGVLSVRGQPTISVANISNGVDFRAIFGRRRNYAAAGLTYTVQFSADNLATWVNSSAAPTVLATDGQIDAVSVPYPLFIATPNGVEKPKFFRVGVSSN